MLKYYILIAVCLNIYPSAYSQNISGYVIDKTTGVGLGGVFISSKYDSTISDFDGSFHLNLEMFPATIQTSLLGYKEALVTINKDSEIRIQLSESSLMLNQVLVTSGLSFDRMIDAPGGLSVIDKTQLIRDSPYSIANAMNRVSGVFMHAGTLNTNRITIRGIGSRSLFSTDKIKAYYDQIPLTDGSGNSTLEDIDQSLIERIEVIKGPNSSIYGAGLGGAIQLRGIQPEYKQTSARSSINIGSFGTRRWMGQLSHSDDKLSLNVNYTDIKSEGFRDNNRFKKQQFGLTSRYYLNEKSYLSFIGIFTDLHSQIPSSLNENDFNNKPKIAAANWQEAQGYEDYIKSLTGLAYHYSPTKNLSISHAISFQYKDTYEPAPGPFVNIMDEQLAGFSTRHIANQKIGKWTLSGGFEWLKDERKYLEFENLHTPTSNGSVKGVKSDQFNELRSYLNFFSEASFQASEKVKLTGGLSSNKTQYELDDKFNENENSISGDYSFKAILSPRFGSLIHILPHTNLYTNISHGFSPPNLEQTLYPNGQINLDIQPETGWNFETGLRGNVSNFSYDLALYFMDIKNLLVARRTTEDQFIGVNAGKNHHFGSDISIEFYKQFDRGYSLRIFKNTALSHYRFKRFVDEDVDHSGNKLTGVPAINMTLGMELLNETGFYGNITNQYTGKMPITDDNELFSKDYMVFRSKVGFRKTFWKIAIDASFGIDNMTDEKYASMLLINSGTGRYYYPGLPRNYFGELGVKYIFN